MPDNEIYGPKELTLEDILDEIDILYTKLEDISKRVSELDYRWMELPDA